MRETENPPQSEGQNTTDVSLREFFELEIRRCDLDREALKQLLTQAIANTDDRSISRNAEIRIRIDTETSLRLQSTALANIALETALHALDERLNLLNEFRKQINDTTNNYVSRDVFDAFKEAAMDKLGSDRIAIAQVNTRSTTWTAAIGIFFMLLNILLYYMRVH